MKPIKATSIETRVVGAEVLVHVPAAGKIHVVNTSAGTVLDLCDGTRTSGDITNAIVDATGADAAIVGPDIAEILERFVALGIVSTL